MPFGGKMSGIWENGELVEGRREWDDGKVYEGTFLDGEMDGEGRMEWPDGTVYVGAFSKNCRVGKGRERSASGSEYEGEFHGASRHGEGRLRRSSGSEWSGTWKKGVLDGAACSIKYSDGCEYEGPMVDGKCHGTMGSFKGVRGKAASYDGPWDDGIPLGVARRFVVRSFGSWQAKLVEGVVEVEEEEDGKKSKKKAPAKKKKEEEEEKPLVRDWSKDWIKFWSMEELKRGFASGVDGWEGLEMKEDLVDNSHKDGHFYLVGEVDEMSEKSEETEEVNGIPTKDEEAAKMFGLEWPKGDFRVPDVVCVCAGGGLPEMEILALSYQNKLRERMDAEDEKIISASKEEIARKRQEAAQEAEEKKGSKAKKKDTSSSSSKKSKKADAADTEIPLEVSERDMKRRGMVRGEMVAGGESGRLVQLTLWERKQVWEIVGDEIVESFEWNPTPFQMAPDPSPPSSPTPSTKDTDQEPEEPEAPPQQKLQVFVRIDNGSSAIPPLYLPKTTTRGIYELRIQDMSERQPGDLEEIPIARLRLLVQGPSPQIPQNILEFVESKKAQEEAEKEAQKGSKKKK